MRKEKKMMSRKAFENRVRKIAAQKKNANTRRFKVIRNTAIASGGVLAACFVVSILIRGQFLVHSNRNMMVGSSGPEYVQDDPNAPDEGINDGLLDINNGSLVQNNQIPPQRIEMQIGDEGFVLTSDVSNEMLAWLNQLNYAKPAGLGDVNSEDTIEVRYIYKDTEKVCMIYENYIKIDDEEWKMFDEGDRDKFDEIIKKIREE